MTNLGIFEWDKLLDTEKQPYYDEALKIVPDDLLFCTRSWSAWGVNTMSENDFSPASDDDGFIESIAKSLYESQNNLRIKEVLNESISAIYFNDNSDYLSHHYNIVKKLTGLDYISEEIINGMFRKLNDGK